MTERRVAEVVRERERLGEVFVEPERAGERPGDLGDFQRMGQACAVMVALVEHEDLGLVLQPPEGGRVDDAVGVAPERAAGRTFGLGMEPPAACRSVGRVMRTCRHRKFPQLTEGSRIPNYPDKD